MVRSVRGLTGIAAPDTVEAVCQNARRAMRDAIDLVLIHNDGPVTGDAPRGVLSPLIVMLAVSAWEGFIYDLGVLHGVALTERETVGRLSGWPPDAERTASQRRTASAQAAKTRMILEVATAGHLPTNLTVTFYASASGKSLHKPYEEPGRTPAQLDSLGWEIDQNIALRNGVAHRMLARNMKETNSRTDAGANNPDTKERGLTINTSMARSVLAAYVQLVDQTIDAVVTAAGLSGRMTAKLRLPAEWFADDVEIVSVHRPFKPGCLWGGASLPRSA